MTTRQVLVKARALIKKGWCQGAYERSGSYCPVGAINKTVTGTSGPRLDQRNSVTGPVFDALIKHIPEAYCIPDWNDDPKRTQAQVLAAFDRAIKACSK